MDNEKATADEFLEREVGGVHHEAVVLLDLEGAAYGAYEHFRYAPDDVPAEWLAAVKLISETHLRRFPPYKPNPRLRSNDEETAAKLAAMDALDS
jgi:hypothetical protein